MVSASSQLQSALGLICFSQIASSVNFYNLEMIGGACSTNTNDSKEYTQLMRADINTNVQKKEGSKVVMVNDTNPKPEVGIVKKTECYRTYMNSITRFEVQFGKETKICCPEEIKHIDSRELKAMFQVNAKIQNHQEKNVRKYDIKLMKYDGQNWIAGQYSLDLEREIGNNNFIDEWDYRDQSWIKNNLWSIAGNEKLVEEIERVEYQEYFKKKGALNEINTLFNQNINKSNQKQKMASNNLLTKLEVKETKEEKDKIVKIVQASIRLRKCQECEYAFLNCIVSNEDLIGYRGGAYYCSVCREKKKADEEYVYHCQHCDTDVAYDRCMSCDKKENDEDNEATFRVTRTKDEIKMEIVNYENNEWTINEYVDELSVAVPYKINTLTLDDWEIEYFLREKLAFDLRTGCKFLIDVSNQSYVDDAKYEKPKEKELLQQQEKDSKTTKTELLLKQQQENDAEAEESKERNRCYPKGWKQWLFTSFMVIIICVILYKIFE